VIWETNAEGPFSFIRGRFLDPNGTAGPVVEVSSRPTPGETEFGYADDPAVAFNPDADEYLVVWSDPNNQGTFGSSADPRAIVGQRVALAGHPVGPDRFVIAPAQTDPGDLTPALDYDAKDGGYLVAWQEATRARDAGRIVGQFLLGSGDSVGDQLQLSTPPGSREATFPAVSFSGPAGPFLAAWPLTDSAAPSSPPAAFGRAVR
jgi:hypothetical protein